ncbi:hypothetical protein [Bacillus sp. 165]|uniref:hypothetical protein n=1 Tax=Bacillus sp. 165 TaxID=1529117 RepID=UPI001AD9FE26|nr:hypothetical protein [Bacillus sp. 165]MBO9131471.1 hypothetical protein [Bacillus sp. 165]
MKVIKELFTKNKLYKAEIIKINDGIYTFSIFAWIHDEVEEENYYGEYYWSEVGSQLSLFDTEENTVTHTARELQRFCE